MKKLLCSRMRLPIKEALHLSHVMMQICRGYLAGQTSKKAGAWNKHLLAGSVPEGLRSSLAWNTKTGPARLVRSNIMAAAGRMFMHSSGSSTWQMQIWPQRTAIWKHMSKILNWTGMETAGGECGKSRRFSMTPAGNCTCTNLETIPWQE